MDSSTKRRRWVSVILRPRWMSSYTAVTLFDDVTVIVQVRFKVVSQPLLNCWKTYR